MKHIIALLICLISALGAQEKIIVLANKFPPLVIQENNKLKGFDIDLLNEISRHLEVDFDIQITEFKDIIPTVANSKNTLGIGGITITAERERRLTSAISTWCLTSRSWSVRKIAAFLM